MPLSEQLKSDMTVVSSDPTHRKVAEKPVVEPLNTPKLKVDGNGTTEVDVSIPFQPLDSDSKGLEMLKSIDAQLKTLSQNVLDLGKGISESTGTAAETQNIPMMLQAIIAKLEKNDRQLTQTLRDNATFQIQVRQGMQQDLDNVREQLSGEQFNPLLKEIASVYVEYQPLLDDESIAGLSRKNLYALFEQLEDILSDYGAEVCRSEVGSVRQTRTCKIIGKIPTGDKEKHNTIAASKKPGVVRERAVLYPEFVDVYVYDSSLTALDQIDGENAEDAKTTSGSAIDSDQYVPLSIEHTAETPIEEIDSERNLGGNE